MSHSSLRTANFALFAWASSRKLSRGSIRTPDAVDASSNIKLATRTDRSGQRRTRPTWSHDDFVSARVRVPPNDLVEKRTISPISSAGSNLSTCESRDPRPVWDRAAPRNASNRIPITSSDSEDTRWRYASNATRRRATSCSDAPDKDKAVVGGSCGRPSFRMSTGCAEDNTLSSSTNSEYLRRIDQERDLLKQEMW